MNHVDVGIEVTANIAEFAAMKGWPFLAALEFVSRVDRAYWHLLQEIHRVPRPAVFRTARREIAQVQS